METQKVNRLTYFSAMILFYTGRNVMFNFFLGTFPIDTTKTRLQVQGQVIDKSLTELKYRGMFHALFRISKEEGLQALYNGIKPALLRQAMYGTLKIGLYHGTKKIIYSDGSKETLVLNVCAGIIAGAASSAICNPTDVLKVRLQAQTQSSVKPNQGMLLAFSDIYRLEGFKGLYRVSFSIMAFVRNIF